MFRKVFDRPREITAMVAELATVRRWRIIDDVACKAPSTRLERQVRRKRYPRLSQTEHRYWDSIGVVYRNYDAGVFHQTVTIPTTETPWCWLYGNRKVVERKGRMELYFGVDGQTLAEQPSSHRATWTDEQWLAYYEFKHDWVAARRYKRRTLSDWKEPVQPADLAEKILLEPQPLPIDTAVLRELDAKTGVTAEYETHDTFTLVVYRLLGDTPKTKD